MRTTREGPQHGDPQGGSSKGTQRGNERRPGQRSLQNAGGNRGCGRYIKRGAAQKVAVTERGRPLQAAVAGSGRSLQAAVTGGRYRERAAVTGDRHRNNALRQDASKNGFGCIMQWPFPNGSKTKDRSARSVAMAMQQCLSCLALPQLKGQRGRSLIFDLSH
jgi:hypothetical protein